MVDQSELPFRMLTRRYKTDLCYTPMVHSVMFITSDKYRENVFDDLKEVNDRPLFIQFCGHDPDILLKAAKMVENKCESIDINFGCPQFIAKRGFYGAFLLENTELVLKILGYLSNNLKCGVSAKIRLFNDLNKSYELAKGIAATGIKVLTVHGRTKEQNKDTTGTCNWDAIKIIKSNLNIPVIANGGIENFEDMQRCFDYTKCDAIMSAEKLLENPTIFSGEVYNIDEIALEYIDLCKKYDSDVCFARAHLFKFLYTASKLKPEYNQRLTGARDLDDLKNICQEIHDWRKELSNEGKFGWYDRYRSDQLKKSLSVKKEEKLEDNCFGDLFG